MLADRPHGRRLTQAELLVLADLERRLQVDDPQLAGDLSGRPARPRMRTLVAAAVVAVLVLVGAAAIGGAPGAVAATLALASTAGVLLLVQRHDRRRSRRHDR